MTATTTSTSECPLPFLQGPKPSSAFGTRPLGRERPIFLWLRCLLACHRYSLFFCCRRQDMPSTCVVGAVQNGGESSWIVPWIFNLVWNSVDAGGYFCYLFKFFSSFFITSTNGTLETKYFENGNCFSWPYIKLIIKSRRHCDLKLY